MKIKLFVKEIEHEVTWKFIKSVECQLTSLWYTTRCWTPQERKKKTKRGGKGEKEMLYQSTSIVVSLFYKSCHLFFKEERLEVFCLQLI